MMSDNRSRIVNGATWLAAATALVAAAEGLATYTYPDVGGVPTYCYGETQGAEWGKTYTKEQCDEQLSKRLVEFNRGVDSCVSVDLPDTRRAALVSLAYNIGVPAFCRSTAVRKLNSGDVQGGCDAILMWNKVNGIVWRGLVNRREKERALCLS
jgi:lysozyme